MYRLGGEGPPASPPVWHSSYRSRGSPGVRGVILLREELGCQLPHLHSYLLYCQSQLLGLTVGDYAVGVWGGVRFGL
jgi:hypothetical protein